MIVYKGRRVWQTMLWGVQVWRWDSSEQSYLTLDDVKAAIDERGAPVVADAELRQRIAARPGGKTWIGEKYDG